MPKAYHFQHTTPFTAEDYAVLKPTRDWEQWQWRQHDMCAAAHRHNKRAHEATHEADEQKQKVLALSGQLNACRGQLEKAQALLGENVCSFLNASSAQSPCRYPSTQCLGKMDSYTIANIFTTTSSKDRQVL